MVNITKVLNRMFSLLLCISVILSTLIFYVNKNYRNIHGSTEIKNLTGSNISTIYGDTLKGSDGKVYTEYGFTAINYNSDGTYKTNKTNNFVLKELIGSDRSNNRSWMYCVEFNTKFSREGYTSSNVENSSYLKLGNTGTLFKGLARLSADKDIDNLDPLYSIECILTATVYGWQPGVSMPKELSDKGLNAWDWYFGTQVIIWEFQQGIRQSPTERKGNGYNNADALYKFVKNRPAEYAYNYVLKMVAQHSVIPSFSTKFESNAPVYNLVWNENNKRYETTLTDTNGYLFDLKFDNGINAIKNGNKYTLYTTAFIDKPEGVLCSASKDINISDNQKLLVWGVAGKQTMATGMQDPVRFSLRIKTEKPVITINKGGYAKADYQNKIFDIFKDSDDVPCLTLITDSQGRSSGNLPGFGTYKIIERNTSAYNVTYTINDTNTQSFSYPESFEGKNDLIINVNNQQKPGYLQIKKTSEDNKVEGMKFNIRSVSTSDGSVWDITGITDLSGNVIYNGSATVTLPMGRYIVTEIDTPDRYVNPDTQEVVITQSNTVIARIANTLKVPKLKIIKTSQDNVIENIEFNVKGMAVTGEEIDVDVKTGADGSVLTEIPQGTYTVTEINIPAKYYTQPPQMITLTQDFTGVVSFHNTIKPGYLQVKKSSEDNVVSGFKFNIKGNGIDVTAYTNKDGYLVYDTNTKIVSLKQKVINGGYSWNTDRYISVDIGVSLGQMLDDLNLNKTDYAIYSGTEASLAELKTKDLTAVVSDYYTQGIHGYSNLLVLYNTTSDSAYAMIILRGATYTNAITTQDISLAKTYIGAAPTDYNVWGCHFAFAYDIDRDNLITQNDIDLLQGAVTDGKFTENTILTLQPGSYTITEIEAPDRYTAGYKGTITVSGDETIIAEVHNLLKQSGVRIIKTSEDGIISGLQFNIKGNGVDRNVTTEFDGTIAVSLPSGTYTITEINTPDRYKQPRSQTVTISGNYATVMFNNVLKPGRLQIKKTSEDNVISGFKFSIESIFTVDSSVINLSGTTNDQGLLVVNGYTALELPEGRYKVTELEVAERYINPEPYIINIKAGESTICSVNNVLKVPKLRIVKTSEDGIVEGLKFNIKGTAITGEIIDIIVITEAGGTVVQELPQGTYTVTEIEVPGRYIASESQTVTLYNDDVTTVTFKNILKTGNLEIIKTSEDAIVEGIVFIISGVSYAGEFVNISAGTDYAGKINVTLKPGKYTVSEILPNNSYLIQEDQEVVVEYGKTATVSFENVLKKFRVSVTKKDAIQGTEQGDGTLQGAVYGLYKGNNLIETYTTDSDGTFTTDYYVCGADYFIKEIAPSIGYELDKTVYNLSCSSEYQYIEFNDLYLTVFEYPILGNIKILKRMGYANDYLYESGAVFQVYLKSAGSYENADERERDIITTDAAADAEDSNTGEAITGGEAGTKDLPYGIYTVKQISGNENYYIIDPFEVAIDGDNLSHQFDLLNEPKLKAITIYKKDITDSEPIEGAAIEIYDDKKVLVYSAVSDINGEIKTTLLPGKYTFKEINAPEGYALNIVEMEFVIDFEGNVKGSTTIYDEPIKVTYLKTDEKSNPLKDAEFGLYDIKGNLVQTAISGKDGIVEFKSLGYGEYTVKEISAPLGYEKSTEEFEIIVDGNWTNIQKERGIFINKLIEIYADTPPLDQPIEKVADTWDTENNIFYVVCIFISIVSILFLRKRRYLFRI